LIFDHLGGRRGGREVERGGGAKIYGAMLMESSDSRNTLLLIRILLHIILQGVRLAVELSEPIQAAVATLCGLEKRAAEALAGLKGSEEGGGAKGSRCDQLLALLHLARWLQLYVVGDAENAEPELAEELAGVYEGALGKGKTFAFLLCHFRCMGVGGGGGPKL